MKSFFLFSQSGVDHVARHSIPTVIRLLVASVLTVATVAQADDPPPAPASAPGASDARPARAGRPARPNSSAAGAQARAGGLAPAGLGDLGRILTTEQRETFRKAMQEQRGKMQELDEKLTKIHEELNETMLAETLDEAAIREKVRQLSEAEGERHLLRARAIARIRSTLTTEQLQQLRDSMNQTRRLRRPGAGLRNGDGPIDRRPRRPGEAEREGADLPPPRPASP